MLIKCIECGKEISDKSKSCPHCGCPTIVSIRELEKESQIAENQDKLFYKCPLCKKEFKEGVLRCDVCKYTSIILPVHNTKELNIPKCPTCGSTNIRRISGSKKAASIIGFGILSSNLGKTYECLNCKHKW